ncbi:MAG: hypothetical protein WCT20_05070 [Candidatus Babeliales bacterium]
MNAKKMLALALVAAAYAGSVYGAETAAKEITFTVKKENGDTVRTFTTSNLASWEQSRQQQLDQFPNKEENDQKASALIQATKNNPNEIPEAVWDGYIAAHRKADFFKNAINEKDNTINKLQSAIAALNTTISSSQPIITANNETWTKINNLRTKKNQNSINGFLARHKTSSLVVLSALEIAELGVLLHRYGAYLKTLSPDDLDDELEKGFVKGFGSYMLKQTRALDKKIIGIEFAMAIEFVAGLYIASLNKTDYDKTTAVLTFSHDTNQGSLTAIDGDKVCSGTISHS